MTDQPPDSTGIADRLRDYVVANHRDPDCCGLARMLSEAVEAIRASEAARAQAEQRFDLHAHLTRQREFSDRTFGWGVRTAGVLDHIRKELREIEAKPHDLSEWIDVVILAFDGAGRAGYAPAEIIAALVGKQARNEARQWPDWRTADPDKAIEHVRAALSSSTPEAK